ncbi:hypothetical protein N7463_009983 [Penicillium fimorum]|uniref:NAD-dependent epimerase/dehydratase domain-containing protein n=1 Tax=Penicillium fimorum TaxID=1882269 RepID=A0A9W9XJ12_9EURO|nr:hypothetical protein N7463_009983 [Penicillium fimorum]
MKILITGGGGFIGQALARKLLQNSANRLVLTDKIDFALPPGLPNLENADLIQADLLEDTDGVVTSDLEVVFILHGIMSSGAEANFDLGFQVNFDATRKLLDSIKNTAPGIRVIYASSIAVYGRPFPERITEDVFLAPEGSYGVQKVMCEALINEYTRRGFIDGFSVRLPGIVVRPGLPAQAASSFLSGIIRDPLAGKRCLVPTMERSKEFWVCSPKVLVLNLIDVMSLPRHALPLHKRGLNLPGSLVTIQQMRDSLEMVGGRDKLDLIEEVEDAEFAQLVSSWPANFDVSLALGLGLRQAEGFDKAAEEYVQSLEYSKVETC